MRIDKILENRMYIWNINQLVDDLKSNKVTQRQFKNYYLVSITFVLLNYLLMSQLEIMDLKIQAATTLIEFGLLITWVNILFKTNGGEQGKQFLNRIAALSLPIGIRVTVAMVFIWVFFEFLIRGYKTEVSTEQVILIESYITAASEISISFVFYWRMYVAMARVNAAS